MRLSGPESRGFRSWSASVMRLLTTSSLLGRERDVLRDQEVQKPPEGVLFCLLNPMN